VTWAWLQRGAGVRRQPIATAGLLLNLKVGHAGVIMAHTYKLRSSFFSIYYFNRGGVWGGAELSAPLQYDLDLDSARIQLDTLGHTPTSSMSVKSCHLCFLPGEPHLS